MIVDNDFNPQEAEHYLAERIVSDMLKKGMFKISKEERKHVTRYTAKVVVVSPEAEEKTDVRCKDCIYYQMEDEPPHITTFMECTRPNPEDPDWFAKWHFRSENDTCPYGVRKKKESKVQE